MNKTNILDTNAEKLSVNELRELERALSVALLKVRNGIIDDSLAGYEPKKLEQKLCNKVLMVQNLITAKSIRT